MSAGIDPANFTNKIDNPYFTLRPGTTFVLAEKEENGSATIVVTHKTKVVDGVTCVVVRDTARINGLVVEDTFDWYAQDKDGNVWYFGEATKEFEPGNPVPDNTHGSWESGVDGARAGIVMKADPQPGDRYRQEYAPGIAEDTAKVLSLDASANVIYGSFDEVLKTRDINPLEPGAVEHKFYAPGVGFILATTPDGGREELARIEVNGLAGDDTLIGYAGGDIMRGQGGDDLVRGLGGNDTMTGGSGSDTLNGGNGGDALGGGAGKDTVFGGDGADRFVFRTHSNGRVETDTIADYSKDDIDVIDLARGVASIASQAKTGGVWHLTLKGDGDTIVLDGVIDANANGRIVDDLLIV